MIYDAVQGILGDEQMSICVWWFYDKLEPQESFVNFQKTGITWWFSPWTAIYIGKSSGQTYDRAGNMSSFNKGLQIIIIQKQTVVLIAGSCKSYRAVKNFYGVSPSIMNFFWKH